MTTVQPPFALAALLLVSCASAPTAAPPEEPEAEVEPPAPTAEPVAPTPAEPAAVAEPAVPPAYRFTEEPSRHTEGGVLVTAMPPEADCPSVRWSGASSFIGLRRCQGKSWAEQVETFKTLLVALRDRAGKTWPPTVLSMGTDQYAYPSFQKRTATAVKKSPKWKKHKGPWTHLTSKMVVEVANEKQTYTELIDILAVVGLAPTLESGEKCNYGGCVKSRFTLAPVAAAAPE